MTRRLTLAPVALALLVTLAACGEDPGTEEAHAAAEAFLQALRDGDGETGCALIDEDAHAAVLLSTMNVPETALVDECEPAFPVYAERFNGANAAQISEVEMGTDSEGEIPIATVHLEYTEDLSGQTAEDIRFWLMDDGEWRIRTVPFGGP